MLTWSVAIAKNNYVDLGLSVRTKNKLPSIKPTLYSHSVSFLSLSPHLAISRSLFLCVLPMIHLWWFHIKSAYCSCTIISVWLTIKVCGRIRCFTYTFDTIKPFLKTKNSFLYFESKQMHYMENLMVIRVEVIAPEKPLLSKHLQK